MDGTVTKTLTLIYESFNRIARQYENRLYKPEELIALFGPPEEVVIRKVAGDHAFEEAFNDYLEFYEHHHDTLANVIPDIPGILEILKEQKKQIALFTGKGRHTTNISLRKLDLEKYFDLVITGNDVPNYKPSGDGIRIIMERLSLGPDRVLMIGDTLTDIRCARDAGVKVASVLWDSYDVERIRNASPDYIFETVDEFKEFISEH